MDKKRVAAPLKGTTKTKLREAFSPNDFVSLLIWSVTVGEAQLMERMDGDMCRSLSPRHIFGSPGKKLVVVRNVSITPRVKRMVPYSYHFPGLEMPPSSLKNLYKAVAYIWDLNKVKIKNELC